ncbi:hypothetical protein ACIOFV_50225 [Streptomyces mirabilis]|uniref:hypothetical protein n=1 Tax=Streptomyces mirabilis TaxID=68239 RepID=UPI00381225D6
MSQDRTPLPPSCQNEAAEPCSSCAALPGAGCDALREQAAPEESGSHVEQQIRARIDRVKRQKADRRQQRAELNEARRFGLEARHATKMRRWAEEDDE